MKSLLALSLMGMAAAIEPKYGGPVAGQSIAQNGKGVARTHTGTKRGKSMVQAKGARVTTEPLSAHNQAIEDARQQRLQARHARRAAQSKGKAP